MQATSNSIAYKTGIERPTWLLILGVYSAWFVLLSFYSTLPATLWLLMMAATLALFGSVCHELLHGHPSNSQQLNDAIGTPALSLYPYFDYKRTHIKHHTEDDLTKPGIDPESFFIRAEDWQSMPRWQQKLAWINMTLAGRVVLGPARSYLGLIRQCVKDYRSNDHRDKRHWFVYGINFLIVLWLVTLVFKVPLGVYILAVYLGHSAIALRSFYEHQTHTNPGHRTVIIPSTKALSFLYLYNNLHVVHHQHPGLAWYLIPAEYRRNKQKYHESNGGFTYAGYLAWLKYLFLPVASPVFPSMH